MNKQESIDNLRHLILDLEGVSQSTDQIPYTEKVEDAVELARQLLDILEDL